MIQGLHHDSIAQEKNGLVLSNIDTWYLNEGAYVSSDLETQYLTHS